MQVYEYEVTVKTNLEELLNGTADITSESERRIIAFKIISLLLSDNTYDELGQGFVELLKEKLEVSEDTVGSMLGLVGSLRNVYKNIEVIMLIEE